MPISGFDLKIKIRTIENNFPFHFFQTVTYILYQNFLFRITHIPIAHLVHANYYRHISILVIQYIYIHTHTHVYIEIHISSTPLVISRARAKPLERRYTNEVTRLCVGLRLKRESSMTPRRTLQDFPRAWVQVQGQVHRATCQSVLVTIDFLVPRETLKNRFHDRNLDSELHPPADIQRLPNG